MRHKAAETTHNINTFGPGTANKFTRQWQLKFCKSPEDEKHTGQPSEVDNDQLRATTETDPHTTTREVAKELKVERSMVLWHLKQIGKVTKLKSGCFMN